MSKQAKLELDGKVYLPCRLLQKGSEGEKAVDVSSLRADTGYITLDERLRQHGLMLKSARSRVH